MGAYRVLTFDGGGIRGLYSAVLLERITEEVPELLEAVDLLAGTSTGGIIALGLARGLGPGELVGLYRDHGKEVFDDSWFDDLKDLAQVIGADYDNRKLKRLLVQKFGNATLRQLKKKVLIPSFDLDNEGAYNEPRQWKPKFFHNYPGPDSDGAELATDVALRTSAAPVYFPTYQGYIDGGVVANNPSMAAIAQAIDEKTGNQDLKDIRLLSIGCGTIAQFIKGDHDWGFAQWAKPLITLMFEGMGGVADFECKRLLGERHFRLSPLLPKDIALDDVRRISDLESFARGADIAPVVKWLKNTFLA